MPWASRCHARFEWTSRPWRDNSDWWSTCNKADYKGPFIGGASSPPAPPPLLWPCWNPAPSWKKICSPSDTTLQSVFKSTAFCKLDIQWGDMQGQVIDATPHLQINPVRFFFYEVDIKVRNKQYILTWPGKMKKWTKADNWPQRDALQTSWPGGHWERCRSSHCWVTLCLWFLHFQKQEDIYSLFYELIKAIFPFQRHSFKDETTKAVLFVMPIPHLQFKLGLSVACSNLPFICYLKLYIGLLRWLALLPIIRYLEVECYGCPILKLASIPVCAYIFI